MTRNINDLIDDLDEAFRSKGYLGPDERIRSLSIEYTESHNDKLYVMLEAITESIPHEEL